MKSANWNYAILFGICLLFHIAGSWSLPLIDRDEPRFAEASREMIERGDYIVPHFNNQLRLDKPPLTYWAQVASFTLFGQNDFAARFPSAVAAALVALTIFAWGSQLSRRLGWWAAIMFTLSLQTFVHAKAAVADMWLVLFMTLAHWAGWKLIGEQQTPNPPSQGYGATGVERRISNPKWRWWSIFYFSLALGFLAKGPIAWTPLLTVATTALFARDLRLAQQFKFVRGTLLVLGLVSVWAIPALIQTHGEFFRVGIMHHVVERSFSTMEGHGAKTFGVYLLLLPLYFVTVFASFFPWSIKLPWLTKKLWRDRDSLDKYLILGALIIFMIFTFVKTKLPHYTLPAFPLLSLLLARHWKEEDRSSFKSIAIAAACVWVAIALVIPPFVSHQFPAYALFQKSRDSMTPETAIGTVEFNEPSLVWYFRSRVKGFLTPLGKKNAGDFLAQPGPRLLIIPETLSGSLLTAHPDYKTFSTTGFNLAKGKHVELALVLKPE